MRYVIALESLGKNCYRSGHACSSYPMSVAAKQHCMQNTVSHRPLATAHMRAWKGAHLAVAPNAMQALSLLVPLEYKGIMDFLQGLAETGGPCLGACLAMRTSKHARAVPWWWCRGGAWLGCSPSCRLPAGAMPCSQQHAPWPRQGQGRPRPSTADPDPDSDPDPDPGPSAHPPCS